MNSGEHPILSCSDAPPDPPGHIQLEKNPSPDKEGGFFSSVDEKKAANAHQLAVHDRNLGSIGRFTGSTNPSLNIAAAIAAGLLVALFVCLIASGFQGIANLGPYIEKLIAAVLTVSGFIFGVRQGGSDKS